MTKRTTRIPDDWRLADPATPRFIEHPSFHDREAEALYAGGVRTTTAAAGQPQQHLADEVTREYARMMHYAAYRCQRARSADAAERWKQRYYALRDRIVLGNRKLIFRAIHKWSAAARHADDLLGECDIVMIRAVAGYNPWLGIRFSTYAFTCLMRALSRLSKRLASDRLLQVAAVEHLVDAVSGEDSLDGPPTGPGRQVDEFLQDDNELLSDREKLVLRHRFNYWDGGEVSTLETVGRTLGLSKERVRQLQVSALGKLRQALLSNAALS